MPGPESPDPHRWLGVRPYWSLLFTGAVISAILLRPMKGIAQTREEAVAMAREGRVQEGIDALRKLRDREPRDTGVNLDLAVILTWASRPAEAIEVFESARVEEPPEYVLAPIIRAYRDQRRFKQAEQWARAAIQRYPLDATWPKLLGLVLADQKRSPEAIAVLKPWTAAQSDDHEIWLAMGYASRVAGDRFGTLRNYGRALRLKPDNQEAASAMSGILVELGGPFGADALVPESPIELRAAKASMLTRWGNSVEPSDPRRRFEGTDLALEHLDRLLREARSASHPDRGLIFRLSRDQIVALRNRERWADVIAAADKLRAAGDTLPSYVKVAVADSLLALRHPTDARVMFESVLRNDPKNRDARIGRFYALVDEENFKEAFREADRLATDEQATEKLPRRSGPTNSDAWLDAQILAVRARNYADMQAIAWDRFAPFVEAAPANAGLRQTRGDLAAARGWPRLSDEEIHIAASLDPKDKGVQLALAETAMRRRRWGEARERLNKLAEIYPGDAAIRRAKVDLQVHDSFEFRAEINHRREKGGSEGTEVSASAPGTGTEIRTRLYTPSIAEIWRFVGAWEWADAKVTEGLARRYREGVGVELALPDLTLEVMGWNNDGALAEPGMDVTLNWQPTDHWTFSAEGSLFSGETPLRAVLNQITVNSAGGSVEYAWSESRSISLAAYWYDFSDGNRRHSGLLRFSQKIVDAPHLDVTFRPEIYASENSSNQGPYFSPLRDFSASLTFDAEHTLWREYEHSFGHRLALTGGTYWQEDFGSGWIGNVLYEQVYRNASWVEVSYGVQCNRAIYDGDPTLSIQWYGRLNWRF